MRLALDRRAEVVKRHATRSMEERAIALKPIWEMHWAEVHLEGDRIVHEAEAETCREALSRLLLPHFPMLADVYLCYAIVIAIVREEEKGKGVADWSLHMTDRLWQHFCSRSRAIDKAGIDAIFVAVNDERHEQMQLAALNARAQIGETALKRHTFSLSEFIEALVRVACVRNRSPAERARGRPDSPLSAKEVESAVVRFMETVVLKHASDVGLSNFRRAMTDLVELNELLVGLTDMHSKVYERFASWAGGIKLAKFLELAKIVAGDVPRTRATAIFVQSLRVESVYQRGMAKLLDPDEFQEALLRLGLLINDIRGGNVDLMGAELSSSPAQMSPGRLEALRSTLEQMELALGPSPEDTVDNRTLQDEEGGALRIQKCARGRLARKRLLGE
jgi:hypothetical protein